MMIFSSASLRTAYGRSQGFPRTASLAAGGVHGMHKGQMEAKALSGRTRRARTQLDVAALRRRKVGGQHEHLSQQATAVRACGSTRSGTWRETEHTSAAMRGKCHRARPRARPPRPRERP